MLSETYSKFSVIGDAKNTAALFLELDKAGKNTISVSLTVQELCEHRLHPVLCSSSEVGRNEQGLLVGFNWGKLEINFHLENPIFKALTVSIVEIGLGDLGVVLVAVSASRASSTNLAGCTSRGVA